MLHNCITFSRITPTQGKALKLLSFSNTTCTSSRGSDALETALAACKTPHLLADLWFSLPNGLVLHAFPNSQLTRDVNEFCPKLTSTPIQLNHSSTCTCETRQVKISVKYPSKTVNKPLSDYQAVGMALAHDVPSQITGAIMNCQPLQKQITEKVLKIVSKEVSGLCSKSNP